MTGLMTIMAATLALATQDAPGTAGEAAGQAVHNVCLSMFDGQPADAARLGTLAQAQGLTAGTSGWVVPSPAGTSVSIEWMGENRVCQVTVTGPSGAGSDLLDEMAGIGWTEVQRNTPSGPDMAVDVWSGQPQGVDSSLFVVANRWTSDENPDGDKRLVLTVVRAE